MLSLWAEQFSRIQYTVLSLCAEQFSRIQYTVLSLCAEQFSRLTSHFSVYAQSSTQLTMPSDCVSLEFILSPGFLSSRQHERQPGS